MHFQAVFHVIAVLPLLASATPYYKLNRRAGNLSVELSQAGAVEVKASVTNIGAEAVHLFTDGTILDRAPVQKLDVTKEGEPVQYTGILAQYLTEDLGEESFLILQPGDSAESVVNIASLYDLTGGEYTISLADAFGFASVGSTELDGVYEFESNTITLTIDQAIAAAVPQAVAAEEVGLEKRSQVVSCSGTQATTLRTAITRVNSLAGNAGTAASSGSATKFQEYFRTTAATTRSNVAARFRSFAQEGSSTTSGLTTYSCVDFAGVCGGGVIAYAQPSTRRIANCSLFWSLRAVSTGCGQQSQASTVLHEFTHCLANTVDHAYGYAASTRLSAAQAYQNADNYALYADAILNNC